MPVPTGRDEHPVSWHGLIIGNISARQGRERAARFVHQKIGRCKVPIMAVAAGKGDVVCALRETGET